MLEFLLEGFLLHLKALEGGYAAFYRHREAFDVTGALADEGRQATLDKTREKIRVLSRGENSLDILYINLVAFRDVGHLRGTGDMLGDGRVLERCVLRSGCSDATCVDRNVGRHYKMDWQHAMRAKLDVDDVNKREGRKRRGKDGKEN